MEPFIHLPSHRVIICTDLSCQYAVLTSHIDRHLSKRYKIIPGKRRDIVNQIMAIPGVFVNKEYLQVAFQNPRPKEPAIPHLPVYSDGLACSYTPCQYICRGKTGIVRHCETIHGWVNPYQRGRTAYARPVRDYPWRTGVYCQRIFTQGIPQEYFEVTPVPEDTHREAQARSEPQVADQV